MRAKQVMTDGYGQGKGTPRMVWELVVEVKGGYESYSSLGEVHHLWNCDRSKQQWFIRRLWILLLGAGGGALKLVVSGTLP